jgi:DNA-binding GntR family transcriptional regulator
MQCLAWSQRGTLVVDLVSIDHGAAEFPFEQLARILRDRIGSGEYPAGRKIPPLIELQEEFQLSSMTVRRAVRELADEGLLLRVPGRGTFVAE